MDRRFHLVDVFGDRPLHGNPLAVVVDADGLATEEMLEITRWLGYSETTFLTSPSSGDADYAVRIFTLAGELPFAGHPTLGSCHVWRKVSGGLEREMVQECGAGLVRLRMEADRYAFATPPLLREGPVEDDMLEELGSVLGVARTDILAARWVDNGPGWVGVMLGSAESVLALEPDFARRDGDGSLDIGVVGMHPEGSDFAYEVRAFFSDQHGAMVEDPVTGSLNASLAQWLLGEGRVTAPYLASQGAAVGRRGRVHVSMTGDGSIWVGGRVFDIVSGLLTTRWAASPRADQM